MTDFVGAARPIIAYDVAAAANVFKIELAALRAVMSVESRNSGFDARRRPVILFEPHIFYRELADNLREVAVARGLAYPNWKGPGSYPSGSDAQYKRLSEAIKISEESAYRSVSMGIGQVLGRNFRAAGCSSAKQMFEQAMDSESNQLNHMLKFIASRGLDDELRRHDWHGFAAGYNGRGQIEKYAHWLEREYAKWKRILAKPREELDVQDLRDAGSKIIASADSARNAVATAAVVGPTAGAALEAAKGAIEPVHQAVETAKQAKDSWDWISENWEFIAVIVLTALFLVACWFAWRAIKQIEEERVLNARMGTNLRI